MKFYPVPFGHVEVHVDRRDPRPPRFPTEELSRRKTRAAKRAR
jgi:hypothetical protein